ncbi:DUF2235 domain-containing protein [Pseudomonas sp. Irchel 3E13]|uniref:T6SS phospholipase effector Tle1-like catalytic domain-containing protein n=1 Tax=Pseudomonas sp. Irchel 3E13 TaxID=2008975 RepID=UPI00135B1770|nr:DUF2235 domain-containing protein [Pseudomonas sp. Irchel 3E13]
MNPSIPSDPHAITLHLGLFFDGTGLNLHNHEQGAASGNTSGSYVTGKSNVARLFELYPQQARLGLEPGQTRAAMALYVEGAGTRRGAADSLLGQATGRHQLGVRGLLEPLPVRISGLIELFTQHNPGRGIRAVEVDLFGFSRGAAAARHFANGLAGICPDCPPVLNFIGLFDTVAGIWAPLKGNFSAANSDYDGLQLGLRAGLARQVVQLVAADERRVNFPLVASDNDLPLPGSHTDIGGGYLPEEQELLRLERPFSSLEPRHLPERQSRAWLQASQCLEQQRGQWEAQGFELSIDLHSSDQPFLPKRDLQREKRVAAQVVGTRRVRGELSLVYLRLMHALAVGGGVPLAPVPDCAELGLPSELHEIAAKLQAYALGQTPTHGLDTMEMALLRRRYIHCSAHWNAPLHSNSPLLDGLFVHRPGAEGQRVIHPNR